jgi:hypothetical protein
MCVAGDTLRMLCKSLPDDRDRTPDRTLDHWSAAALARNMIEATVMFSYLSESGVSEDEWGLRKLVLWNHDATTRYRMFKGLKQHDQANQFKRSTIFDQKLDSTLFLVNLIMIAEKRSTREQRSIYADCEASSEI